MSDLPWLAQWQTVLRLPNAKRRRRKDCRNLSILRNQRDFMITKSAFLMGESVVSNVALRVRESQGEISSGQSLVARSHVCCFQKTFKHQQLISTWHIKAYLNEVYQVYSFESLVFTSPSPTVNRSTTLRFPKQSRCSYHVEVPKFGKQVKREWNRDNK